MAKKSSIEKNNRRRRLSKKYSGKRSRLKAIARDKSKPMEERFAATLRTAAQVAASASPFEEALARNVKDAAALHGLGALLFD